MALHGRGSLLYLWRIFVVWCFWSAVPTSRLGVQVGAAGDPVSDNGKNGQANNTTANSIPSNNSNNNCLALAESGTWKGGFHFPWQRKWRRPEIAYVMMVLSTMSYWEFPIWAIPNNVTSFGLLQTPFKEKLTKTLKEGASFPPLLALGANETRAGTSQRPKQKAPRKSSSRYYLQYFFHDWYEQGVAGVSFHDTEVLLAVSGDGSTLIVSFAGTSSTADAVTNLQTFEPANHSGFYHGGYRQDFEDDPSFHPWKRKRRKRRKKNRPKVEGSLHRGFLNAYSRVDRGSVLRLCTGNKECGATRKQAPYLRILDRDFGTCTSDHPEGPAKTPWWKRTKQRSKRSSTNANMTVEQPPPATTEEDILNRNMRYSQDSLPEGVQRRKGKGGCFTKGKHLSTILQEVVTLALQKGKIVHVTGHSLGGSLATHLALDTAVNHPDVPIGRLHLWTFGAPQMADETFLTSMVQVSPRLWSYIQPYGRNNGRLHRYVTLSDTCQVDAVSEVTVRSLPSHRSNLRGRFARGLGGVHGTIIHMAEPHYLLTPQQHEMAIFQNQTRLGAINKPNLAAGTTTSSSQETPQETHSSPNKKKRGKKKPKKRKNVIQLVTPKTHSTLAAHLTVNYLHGISRESKDHPLQTDFPEAIRNWLGEPT